MTTRSANPIPGGIVLAGLFIFLAGAGCSNAWRDDPKPVVHTKVKVLRVPDTHVIHDTKTKRVQVPIPQVCTEALDSLTQIRSHDDKIADGVKDLVQLTFEGQRIMVKGDSKELVPIEEEMTADRDSAAAGMIAKEEELLRFDRQWAHCQAALHDK